MLAAFLNVILKALLNRGGRRAAYREGTLGHVGWEWCVTSGDCDRLRNRRGTAKTVSQLADEWKQTSPQLPFSYRTMDHIQKNSRGETKQTKKKKSLYKRQPSRKHKQKGRNHSARYCPDFFSSSFSPTPPRRFLASSVGPSPMPLELAVKLVWLQQQQQKKKKPEKYLPSL